jgi:hypothetical protein
LTPWMILVAPVIQTEYGEREYLPIVPKKSGDRSLLIKKTLNSALRSN